MKSISLAVIILLFLLSSVCFAQQKDQNQYLEDIELMITSYPQNAIASIEQLILTADNDDTYYLTYLHHLTAEAHLALGQGQQALKAVELGISQLTEKSASEMSSQEKALYSALLADQSTGFYFLNDHNSAQNSAENALKLARASGSIKRITNALIVLSDVDAVFGMSERALASLLEAYNQFDYTEEPLLYGALLSAIGNSYVALENEKLAIPFYEQAIEAYGKEQVLAINIIQFNLANCYWAVKDYTKTEEILQQVIKTSELIDDNSTLAYSFYLLGEVYHQQNKLNDSLNLYQLADQLGEQLVDLGLRFSVNIALAKLYIDKGFYEAAEKNLAMSESLMGDSPSLIQKREWLYEKASLAAAQKDYSHAYEYAQQFSVIDSQHYQEFSKKNVIQLRNELRIQKIQLEQERLAKANAFQEIQLMAAKAEERQYILFIALILSILSFVLISFYRERKMTRSLVEVAARDDLTGLLNRRAGKEAIEAEIQRFQRYQEPFCVALLDLDYFKSINDEFGHLVGDSVLVFFSNKATKFLRANDVFCRWGGEEFLLVLPQTHIKEAKKLGERLLKSCQSVAQEKLELDRAITFSMGITECQPNTSSLKELVAQADKALYRAKENGRARVEIEC